MRSALAIGIAIGLTVGISLQHLRHAKLESARRQLQAEVGDLKAKIATLTALRESASTTDPAATEQQRLEVLRLRNQAAQLRESTNELQRLRAQLSEAISSPQTVRASGTSSAADELVPRAAWQFAGFATPEAAFQSLIFAMSQGDHAAYLASLTGEEARRTREKYDRNTPEAVAHADRGRIEKVTSYRILQRDDISPDQAVLVIFAAGDHGQVITCTMQKVDNEWRFAGPATDRIRR